MNPDGTGFIDFFGNHRGGFRWKQREMPDGRVVFVDSVFHHCFGGGRLGMITPGGPNDDSKLMEEPHTGRQDLTIPTRPAVVIAIPTPHRMGA